MEGSGPPVSQELVYARGGLAACYKALVRLCATTQEPVKTQIFDVIWDLGKVQGRLTELAEQARASEP